MPVGNCISDSAHMRASTDLLQRIADRHLELSDIDNQPVVGRFGKFWKVVTPSLGLAISAHVKQGYMLPYYKARRQINQQMDADMATLGYCQGKAGLMDKAIALLDANFLKDSRTKHYLRLNRDALMATYQRAKDEITLMVEQEMQY